MEESRHIATSLPGPRSLELMQRRQAAVPLAVYNTLPVFAKQARNGIVEDVDSNRLIDLASGIGVLSVGSGSRAVLAALANQADLYTHTCFHVIMNEPYVQLAEALNGLVPGSHDKQTLLVNSGAEAVEAAVRIARAYTKRERVVVCEGGFHGRSFLTGSMSLGAAAWRDGLGSLAHNVDCVPFSYPYRCSEGAAPDDCGRACLKTAVNRLQSGRGDAKPACLVIEPVQGVGGGVVPSQEFMHGLWQYCQAEDIPFVVDEVQTGLGRTGRWFASEHFGIVPDLVVTGKALGGGLPLGAVTGPTEFMEKLGVGSLGSTFGGNPVACAAGLATLEQIREEELVSRASHLGEVLHKWLVELQGRYQVVGDVRGLGAMVAVELVADQQSKKPAIEASSYVFEACWREGVVVLKGGVHGNVIRLLPPLTIPMELLSEGLTVLEAAVARADERQ